MVTQLYLSVTWKNASIYLTVQPWPIGDEMTEEELALPEWSSSDSLGLPSLEALLGEAQHPQVQKSIYNGVLCLSKR